MKGLRGAPSKAVHDERERVYGKLVRAAQSGRVAVFEGNECRVLVQIFETLALEATGANMRIEKEPDPSIPTVGHMDIPGGKVS